MQHLMYLALFLFPLVSANIQLIFLELFVGSEALIDSVGENFLYFHYQNALDIPLPS